MAPAAQGPSTASSATRQNAYRAVAGARTRAGRRHDAAKKERDCRLRIIRHAARSRCSDLSGDAIAMGHHPVEDLGRGEDAREPGARMRSRADEIEAADVLAHIVRSKPGALPQHGLQAERG